jgi:hypothetical protein
LYVHVLYIAIDLEQPRRLRFFKIFSHLPIQGFVLLSHTRPKTIAHTNILQKCGLPNPCSQCLTAPNVLTNFRRSSDVEVDPLQTHEVKKPSSRSPEGVDPIYTRDIDYIHPT